MGSGSLRFGRHSDDAIDRMSYDQLLALGERLGAARPAGASAQSIDALPTYRFQKVS
jgi:hypothetical protein